jgi:hypothetical protein
MSWLLGVAMKSRYLLISICVSLLVPILADAESSPTVTRVFATNGSDEAGLGDELTVEVSQLEILLDRSNCVNSGLDCAKQNVALFLNGMPLRGIQPVVDIHKKTLRYPLQRTDPTKDVWAALLGSPKATTRAVTVSVGLENGYPLPTRVDTFQLILLRRVPSVIALLLVLALLVLLLVKSRNATLLRDPGPATAATAKADIPYSLGRVQMAWWFFLVVASFVFIWLTTGQHDTLPAQVLTLIGIGTGTALGSALIDSNKKTENESSEKNLAAEQAALNNRLRDIDAQLTTGVDKTALEAEKLAKMQRLEVVKSDLDKAAKTLTPLRSTSFFADILSDANGITFHRFQLLVWTIVLGIVFCASVYKNLAMPQFNDTMLALMGITSGTYIGFKFPEQH